MGFTPPLMNFVVNSEINLEVGISVQLMSSWLCQTFMKEKIDLKFFFEHPYLKVFNIVCWKYNPQDSCETCSQFISFKITKSWKTNLFFLKNLVIAVLKTCHLGERYGILLKRWLKNLYCMEFSFFNFEFCSV